MRNISIIRNYNQLSKDYINLQKRIEKVLLIIEKQGESKGWETEQKIPEHLSKRHLRKIYKILKG